MNDVIRDTVKNHNKQPGTLFYFVLTMEYYIIALIQASWNGGCWWSTPSAWRWCLPAPRCTSSRRRGSRVSLENQQQQPNNWNILVCETIEKRREPMPAMEAIYLIGSSDASVKCLLQDFSSQNRTTYKFAHVYFTEGNMEIKIIWDC